MEINVTFSIKLEIIHLLKTPIIFCPRKEKNVISFGQEASLDTSAKNKYLHPKHEPNSDSMFISL
jgi:hypothetical protein